MTAIRENGAASGIGVLGTYAYDNLGRRTTLTRGNGTTTSYAFDPVSRLSSLIQDLAGTTNDLTINAFSYNPASQIGALTRSNDTYAWGGHYNVNRNYTLNGLNQMTAAGATSLSYDGRGNLTASGTNAYAYSSENLMVTGPASATLGYDPALRLYQSVGAGVTTRFQYDGSDMIGEYNASNALLRRYVHGPGDDEPLVWYEGSGTTDRRWLHADERGSVIAISDGSGAVLGINRYDEYGIPQATNLGRFGFTGQAWLPEIGMNYYKARIYSPTLGRFMQADPIGYDAGMNLYNYVGSDPVNFTDPLGLEGEDLQVTAACAPRSSTRPCPALLPLGPNNERRGGDRSDAERRGNGDRTQNKKTQKKQPNKDKDNKKCISLSEGPVNILGGGFTFVLGGGGSFSVAHFTVQSTGASGWVTSGGGHFGLEAFVGGIAGSYNTIGDMLGKSYTQSLGTTGVPLIGVSGTSSGASGTPNTGLFGTLGAGGGGSLGYSGTKLKSSNRPLC